MTAHPVMQAHWDNKLTLKQNYKNLGLTVRLNKPAGGEEATIKTLSEYRQEKADEEARKKVDPSEIANETDPAKIPEGEARLIRDPETNEVVQVIYGTMKPTKAQDANEPAISIIDELEKFSEQHPKKQRAHTLSAREAEWMSKLHEKYGDDVDRMQWDKKLNPMLVTSGQLKKKLRLWKAAHN